MSDLVSLDDVCQSTILVTNALDQTPDEGIRIVAKELSQSLSRFSVPTVQINDSDTWAAKKLLLKSSLRRAAQSCPHPTVLYIPTQSLTVGTFIRMSILREYVRSKVVVIPCQGGSFLTSRRASVPLGRPDLILSPSQPLVQRAKTQGLDAQFLPLAVDVGRFSPKPRAERDAFRRRHSLDPQKPLILHTGHLRTVRNLQWLTNLTQFANVLVVAGTSRGMDGSIASLLEGAGIKVISEFLPSIEAAYGAADCYAFPVLLDQGSVGVPLSVLEAMASNLPVVTTPFGGLPTMFEEGDGLFFASNEGDFRVKVSAALSLSPDEIRTRDLVQQYSWDALSEQILRCVMSLWT